MIKSILTFLTFLLFLILLSSTSTSTSNILVNAETDYAISPVSLLLPYSTSKYRKPYKLEANKGCFEWINTNPDLVEITPIYDSASCSTPQQQQQQIGAPDLSWDQSNQNQKKCSKAVLVSVRASTSNERNSAFIYAEEQVTGKKLQCEVFVDKISTIVIETTTKTMYKDDLEELHVRAYDSVGNVFSSIVGLEFEWSIKSGNIIQIVPFRGFPLDDVALKMEQERLQTSFVLVQGVDTGSTQITTKLTDSNYIDISHSTTISILEPLQLNPGYLIYVIPGTQIQYQLLTKKRTVLENIPLPNPNYIWSSSNQKVGQVDNSGSFLALDLGKTDIKVIHKSMPENKIQSFINVVSPSYMAIKIEPINSKIGSISNWNLIEKRDYILIVELYDASGHKIHSQDISFDVSIPSEYFEPIPLPKLPTGTQKRSDTYYLKTIKQGSVQLKASLSKVYDIGLKKYTQLLNPIIVEQTVTIHSQIILSPQLIYLPYLPKNKQSYTFRPSGGSGEYNWYSNNTSLATVDSNGSITTMALGKTEIIVTDKKNNHNREQSVVVVLEPDQIIFTPSPVEVEVGKKLQLSAKLLSKLLPKGIEFDSCTINDLEWRIDSDRSFELLPLDQKPVKKSNEHMCSIREFLATSEGSSIVTITYGNLREEIKIFAYPPLKADHNEILLSLGSTADIYFRGGPEPWYLEPTKYFTSIVPDVNENSMEIKEGNGNSFKVTCLKHTIGQQNIVITVGNKVSSSNQYPASPSISIPYHCSQPSSVQLSVLNNEQPNSQDLSNTNNNIAPSCQDTIFSIKKQKFGEVGTYKIRNNRDIPFVINVFDENGKQFTNYSSLQFKWESTDEKQARWINNQKNHLSTLSLSKQQGKVKITSSVVGYNQELLRQLKIYSSPSLDYKRLTTSLELDLISSVELSPSQYTMYLNEKNQLKVEAVGGSKNFAFSSNTSKVASLSSQPNSDFVIVTPLQQGYIKIDVRDICLGSDVSTNQQSSPAIVHVSEAHSIELDVKDMVQVGNSIKLNIRAFAQNGQEFDSSQYQYMKILPHIDNPNILTINQVSSQVFNLKGLDQGLVTLTVTITNPKTLFTTTSKTHQIQVFPPFKVSPNILQLVPGGLFQIHWTGGAPIRQDVSFTSMNPSIVQLSKEVSGELLALKVGETTITAVAEIIDPITGKKSPIGEDKLTVIVKNMTGIRIHSSINKILVGDEAKLRVIGANNETPFTYGTVDLFFKWECLDNNIATLLPIYESNTTTVESEGSFSVRVLGKNPGSTSITVWAFSGSDRSKLLFQSAPLQINILPDIPIQTTSLLLPLNTVSTSFILNNHLDKNDINFIPLSDQNGLSTCKDVIEIGDTKISSLDKIGTCYVSLIRNNQIDTSKLIKINSKPFSHLEILPINPTSTVIPVGGTMQFAIYLRDDIGEIFTEYGQSIYSHEVSNSGVISTSIDSNSTSSIITIKGIRAGVVTLHVYLKDMPHLDDYIKIFVGRLIEPYTPLLHIGSSIQFSISKEQLSQRGFSLPSNDEKVWKSGNSSIISIDSVSGKANTHQTGITTINYIRNPSSQTQVIVSKISKVKVDFGNQVINNLNEKYKYILKFFNENDVEFTNLSNINQNIRVVCSIQESGFASAYSEKVILSNGQEQYTCVVQPTGKPTSTTDKVTLFIQVSNSDKTYTHDTTVNLPFESSFSVLNVKSNQINLSGRQNQFTLQIQSSNPIFVESSDNTLLSVQQLSSTGMTNDHNQGVYKYIISPINQLVNFNSVPLYISSADGRNKQTINVSYSKSGSPSPSSSTNTQYSNNYYYIETSTSLIGNHPILATLCIVIATFAIGLYTSRKHNNQPRVYMNPQMSTSTPLTSSQISSPYRSQPPPHSFASSFPSPNKSQYGNNSIYLNN